MTLKLRQEILIEAPAEAIWEFVHRHFETGRVEEVYPLRPWVRILSWEKITPGPVGVGSTMRWEFRTLLGRKRRLITVVRAWNPPRLAQYETTIGWPFRASISVEPISTTQTRVAYEAEIDRVPLVVNSRVAGMAIRKFLSNWKRTLERSGGEPWQRTPSAE